MTSAAIFRRGGLKEELFGSNQGQHDAEQLDRLLQDQAAVWATQRAGWVCTEQHYSLHRAARLPAHVVVPHACSKALSAGLWRPAMGAVEVVVRGKQLFTKVGFTCAKKYNLHIEEAV